jgi:ribosomal-protein-alanine N-acetyltransferase
MPLLVQAQLTDLDAVRAINLSAGPDPWPNPALLRAVRDGELWLARTGDTAVGFLVSQPVLDETTLMHLAMSAEHQRQGWARQMLMCWIERERASGQQRLLLEVRRSNQAALSLYRSLNFEQIGVRPRYYQTAAGAEDALVMALTLFDGQTSLPPR